MKCLWNPTHILFIMVWANVHMDDLDVIISGEKRFILIRIYMFDMQLQMMIKVLNQVLECYS